MQELALFGGVPAVTSIPQGGHTIAPSIDSVHAATARLAAEPGPLSGLSGAGAIAEFEQRIATYLGAPHVLSVSSGTAALHTALLAGGVEPGDEVIVPAYTWPQTITPVLLIGAVPRFVDIDPERYGVDPDAVARAISSRTKAIIVVHLYGQPAAVVDIRDIAERVGVTVIEDCAQAFGAHAGGVSVGCVGHIGCFSIGPGKILTGGEGGFIVTRDRRSYERCVRLTQHPVRQRFELWGAKSSDFGMNYRMHPMAALIATAELERLDARLARRGEFFDNLGRALSGLDGVRPRSRWPAERCANYRYCPTFVPDVFERNLSRDVFVEALRCEGVPIDGDPVRRSLHRRSLGPFRAAPSRPERLPHTDRRCMRTGLAIAGNLAERASIGSIEGIAEAFRKVAFHAPRLRNEIPDRLRERRGV